MREQNLIASTIFAAIRQVREYLPMCMHQNVCRSAVFVVPYFLNSIIEIETLSSTSRTQSRETKSGRNSVPKQRLGLPGMKEFLADYWVVKDSGM